MVTKLFTIPLQTICRLRFQTSTGRATHTAAASDLAALLEEKLNAELPTKTNNGATIYKVPYRLRAVEPKAYKPNIVSIGPYHHGARRLQAMENTKWNFFHRLFNPTNPNRPNLNALVNELKDIEDKARGCYSENLNLISSKKFIRMMLIDSCFVVELLRETQEIDFSKKSMLIKRWMLPVLQRDLIMLENQLPLFVLNTVYKLTSSEDTEESGLKKLSYQFFESMIYRDSDTPNNNELGDDKDCGSHFLEQFRASMCPTEVLENKFLVKEPHMFRSITDLKESGVKVKKAEKGQPLDVSFKKGVLKIAPVSMDDHKFTLLRNMVAFEQCHVNCKPHVTAYIFFLDRLINSAEDIDLLHYAGVMQHTLGGNKHAARLVNNLCKEVAAVVDDSYLRDVLWKINCYCNNFWHQKRAKLKHEYFYNIWVSLSTIAAVVLIYLTILQTVSALGDRDAREHFEKHGYLMALIESFFVPFTGLWLKDKENSQIDKCMQWVYKSIKKNGYVMALIESFFVPFTGLWPFEDSSMPVKENSQIDKYMQWIYKSNIDDDIKPFFFMSC